jgi:hypothetical protein
MITQLNKIGLKPVRDYYVPSDGENCLVSLNPKAYDSRRAIGFRQDKPSETAGIDSYNVYTEPTLKNYHAGAPYGSSPVVDEAGVESDYATLSAFPIGRERCPQNYRQVNNAQIAYYVDNTISRPFFEPIFDMPAREAYEDYTDPMGSWKPHYTRVIESPEKYSCLSFINDTSFQREDIIARQMALRNQQRSEPFLSEAARDLFYPERNFR